MTALMLLASLHTARNASQQDQNMFDRFNVTTPIGFTVLIERVMQALFGRALRPALALSARRARS